MILPFALWGTSMAAMTPLVSSGGPELVAFLRLLPAGSNLNEATNSGPALDTKGVIAAIEVPQSAKGSIIKNQFKIKFIKSTDNLFIVI